MTIRTVDFVSQGDAEGMPAQPNVAVISISTPGTWEPMLADFQHILRLEFHDVDDDDDAEPWVYFDAEHARQLIDFVERLHSADDSLNLVVHCKAGLSRSPAIAIYVAATTGCEFARRQEAVEANLFVLRVLSAASGLQLIRPTEAGQ
jgi:predicted protein tyrosine phosphatase